MSQTPAAFKQISTNPAAGSVTAPTDANLKAKDVERKMNLYGVIEAFRQGKMPSNRQQISETLDYVIGHSPIDEKKLSKDGRGLIEDFRDLIRTAKQMVEERNADELLQNFIYHTRDVDYSKGDLSKVSTSVNKDDTQKDGEQAIEHLRTLAKLLFTNSEARKLLKDVGILGRDVAADAAAKASEVARPSERELQQIDETAPSKEWVGPNGEKRGVHQYAPDTGLGETRDQLVQARNDAQTRREEFKNDVANQAQGHAQNVAHAADRGQQAAGGEVARDEDRARAAKDAGLNQAQEEGDKVKAKGDKLGNKVAEFRDRIPQEHKDKAKEQLEQAKSYAKDKFPEERRERFIYRLKKIIVENQSHRDYQEAIEFFLERAESYHGVAKDATSQSGDKAITLRNGEAFQQAEKELRTLLERFANGQSMQPMFDAVNQLYKDAKDDDELAAWFNKLDNYVRQVLQEPGYVMEEQCDKEGNRLLEESKKFYDPKTGRYAGHKDALFDSIQQFFTSYADDPLNVELGNGVKKLTTDLLYDSEGSLKYKAHLWNDVRSIILPALAKNVGYVPIPRIEYTDRELDVVIENLTLESQNLIPNIIEIEAKNYFKLSPYDQIRDISKHSFVLSFSQVQADLKDVAFYIKKKQGFPKLTDSGIADVQISGNGVSGKIHIESTGKAHHAFKVVDCKIKIDSMKFAVRESKHSFLISLIKPLASGLIKKGIAAAIEGAIRSGLQQLDAQIADIAERLEAAQEAEGVDNKFDAVKAALRDKKREAEKVAEKHSDAQFNITARRESKLINVTLPNSIVEMQGEKADRAQESREDGWKSSAFDIVPSSGSSLPSRTTSSKPIQTNATAPVPTSGSSLPSRTTSSKPIQTNTTAPKFNNELAPAISGGGPGIAHLAQPTPK
ncbi:BQ5605_C014g07520 [Microbotryum silenes-dioicae]|uniref:BQ5605_C014g07520 protein n=1 Tax=Microbotryum silenes-dioicae TaxID=796604 RepID=A0A2X0NXA6_9BASI|nr:BQ5605_C014g07520 [Microbotryum silenes-dioicae]